MEMPEKHRSGVAGDANDFRNFLDYLEEIGELVRVKKTVNPRFELAAVVSKF